MIERSYRGNGIAVLLPFVAERFQSSCASGMYRYFVKSNLDVFIFLREERAKELNLTHSRLD